MPRSVLAAREISTVLYTHGISIVLFKCMHKKENRDICKLLFHYYIVAFYIIFSNGPRRGTPLNVKNPITLYKGGFSKHRETVFIIHGFNGTAIDIHLQFLRDGECIYLFNYYIIFYYYILLSL